MNEPQAVHGVPEGFDQTLKRLTLGLREAERNLASGGLPQKTLEELSETIDHIRATTWAVLNSVSDEFSDPHQAPTLLTAHRIQRIRSLLLALSAEMDSGHIKPSTAGASELCASLGATYKKLHYLIHGKPVPREER